MPKKNQKGTENPVQKLAQSLSSETKVMEDLARVSMRAMTLMSRGTQEPAIVIALTQVHDYARSRTRVKLEETLAEVVGRVLDTWL